MFKKLFGFSKKETAKKETADNNESLEENKIENEEASEEVVSKVKEKASEDVVSEESKEEVYENAVSETNEDNAETEELSDDKKDVEAVSDNDGSSYIEDNSQEDMNEGREKPSEKKEGLFARLKKGLSKAKRGITDRIDEVLKSYTKVDEELFEDLEEVLITADVGVNTTMEIIDMLTDRVKEKRITDPMLVRDELKAIVREILSGENCKLDVEPSPCVIVMVGVNGVGKTTTIGKLAMRYKSEGKKVMLAAADTFRAAATEQLDIWAKRTNTYIIKHQEGADPGAVVFDAIKSAKSKNTDVLICDTAGRLHNKANLMNELGKIFKIIDREFPEAKKEVLLVVDATTGQNAVVQAKTFKEVASITGIVLTKLDGTAKGGVVLAVKSEVDVPVKLIGVGEGVEDLQDFDPDSFTDALFGN